jgi:hypothetical protein
MPSTYELIASSIPASPTTGITISGINQTYRHLMIKASFKTDYGSGVTDRLEFTVNGLSSLYYLQDLGGDTNSPVGAGSRRNTTYLFMLEASGATTSSSSVTNTFSNMDILFPNYSQNGPWKIYYGFGNVDSSVLESYMDIQGGISSANTNAITSINIQPYAGTNFVVGSSVYLYGLTVA